MGGNLFGVGLGELIFLAILVLIVFGPKRIPEISRSVGRFVRQIREATAGFDQEVRGLMEELEEPLKGMEPLEPPEQWLQPDTQAPRRPPRKTSETPSSPSPQQDNPAPEEVDSAPPSLFG